MLALLLGSAYYRANERTIVNKWHKTLYIVLYFVIAWILYELFITSVEWAFIFLSLMGADYVMKNWGIDVQSLLRSKEKPNWTMSLVALVVALVVGALVAFYIAR